MGDEAALEDVKEVAEWIEKGGYTPPPPRAPEPSRTNGPSNEGSSGEASRDTSAEEPRDGTGSSRGTLYITLHFRLHCIAVCCNVMNLREVHVALH